MQLVNTNILILTDEELLAFYNLVGNSSIPGRTEGKMGERASRGASKLFPYLKEAVIRRGLIEDEA